MNEKLKEKLERNNGKRWEERVRFVEGEEVVHASPHQMDIRFLTVKEDLMWDDPNLVVKLSNEWFKDEEIYHDEVCSLDLRGLAEYRDSLVKNHESIIKELDDLISEKEMEVLSLTNSFSGDKKKERINKND